MFKFVDQYHFFSLKTTFYHLQNGTLKTSLCFAIKERPKTTYQPHPRIYIIRTSVTAVFYHLTLKIQSAVRGVHLHS